MSTADTTPAKRKTPNGVRWQKGQSGNPAGKRKGTVSLASALQRLLTKEPEKLEAVARTLVDGAIAGDISACRLLFERLDGHKPTGFFSVTVDNSDRRSVVTVSPQILSEIAESRRKYESERLCPASATT